MLDPLPPPPPWLVALVKPACDALSLPTLAYHIHEVLFAFVLYQTTQSIISPVLSNVLFPDIYPKLNKRTRINWDVHAVSLVQSCLINSLALWVMWTDEERSAMGSDRTGKGSVERIYGYTGASGLIQAFATGYFVWDIVVSTRYLKVFGIGIWLHAVTALSVFSFGFRPFCNYYGPVFILYELSSPFLNVHWFCDKLNMTGSKLQWYNGMLLLVMFFSCRLVWGTYQSLRVYQDVWHAMHLDAKGQPPFIREVHESNLPGHSIFVPRDGQLCLGDTSCIRAQSEVMKFTGPETLAVPIWLAGIYLVSNLVLNSLNFYWFAKMIETVRKRFQGKPHDEFANERERRPKRTPSMVEQMASELDKETLSGPDSEEKIEAVGRSTAVPVDGELKKR
ncbi:hypothetical protein PV05_08605 [Exophiala xenobiotica]|uniref:TLC domain-containing protein n=1 Tax=Exophiala xenobiotica TaxID=348802 RepID=A0A0D2EZ63_9EURO|nr:uncharacterized protein PV05_08605 [Exophiala xenobiotica]KIW52999.1 hypothetical protein PV05_08605 [Exophiala xenobiotica]